MTHVAQIVVTVKQDVLDPQGKAVQQALASLGFHEVQNVRVGKYIEVTLDKADETQAMERLTEMCDTLLVNAVVEEYTVRIKGGPSA